MAKLGGRHRSCQIGLFPADWAGKNLFWAEFRLLNHVGEFPWQRVVDTVQWIVAFSPSRYYDSGWQGLQFNGLDTQWLITDDRQNQMSLQFITTRLLQLCLTPPELADKSLVKSTVCPYKWWPLMFNFTWSKRLVANKCSVLHSKPPSGHTGMCHRVFSAQNDILWAWNIICALANYI